MANLAITGIFIPFLLGFLAYLIPSIDRYLGVIVSILSIGFGGYILYENVDLTMTLIDRFGVTLTIDSLSGYFILTNGLVSLAVIFYCWGKSITSYFFSQLIILHGSVNSVFCCADFVSLYVALEVISIATFLLISYPRSNKTIWVALRYLFVSNTVMLFYLVGVALVFQDQNSFAFTALQDAPFEAVALILAGLLTKGGIFVSGMWLPLTYEESDSTVAALSSGIIIKTAIFPIVRCAQISEELTPIVEIFSMGTAAFGVTLAILSSDVRRIFAFSTISQLSYILIGGNGAGLYALTHGLAKAGLFLSSDNLKSRKLREISDIPIYLWLVLSICSLSIMGIPFLPGFGAKALVFSQLPSWQSNFLSICSIGSVINFSRIVLVSFSNNSSDLTSWDFKLSSIFLVISLILSNFLYLEAYTISKITATLIIFVCGMVIYWLIKHLDFNFKSSLEKLENLIGVVTVIMIIVFGILSYEFS